MTGPRIRAATPADAASLSSFAATTFTETFAADNDPADLASFLADTFTAERQRAEIADPRCTILLAESIEGSCSELAGYAHVVESSVPSAVTGRQPIELKRFYIGKQWQGRGFAHHLMDAVFAEARARDAHTLWLGVWEHNPRAISFYRKFGFERVGEHIFKLGSDLQTDWLMSVDLERSNRPGASIMSHAGS